MATQYPEPAEDPGKEQKALVARPMAERIGHLAGSVELPRAEAEPWRKALRERNWRS